MTLKLGLIVLGSLLIYGSWKDLSIRSLIFGDNTTTANHPITGPGSASSSTPPSSSSSSSTTPGESTSGQSSPAGPGAAAHG